MCAAGNRFEREKHHHTTAVVDHMTHTKHEAVFCHAAVTSYV